MEKRRKDGNLHNYEKEKRRRGNCGVSTSRKGEERGRLDGHLWEEEAL